MIAWDGVAAGMNNRMKEDHASRREMAEAFMTFKAQNPHASAAEFQSFIDQYSGGRNYIRGGAPSADILRTLGLENQRKKAAEERAARLAEIQERAQTGQLLQQIADDALLSMDGEDYAGAQNAVLAQFGPDGASLLEGYDVSKMVSPSRRQRIVGERVREALPSALEIIRQSDGKISARDLQQAFPDLPGSVLDPLLTEAKRVHQEEQETRDREKQLQVANAESTIRASISANPNFQNAVRLGNTDAMTRIIEGEIGRFKSVYPDAFGPDFATSLITEATATAEALQLQEHQTIYDTAQAAAEEAVTELERASREAVENAFQTNDNGAPSSATGATEENPQRGLFARMAAQELAKDFDMRDPKAVQTLINFFTSDEAEALSYTDMIQMGGALLGQAGIPTMEASRMQVRASAGPMIPPRQTFEEWVSTAKEVVQSDVQAMQAEITEALKIEDPMQLKAAIDDIQRRAAHMQSSHMQQIQDASTSRTQWIVVGTPGWNEAQLRHGRGALYPVMEQSYSALANQLQQLARIQTVLATHAPGRSPSIPPQSGFGPPASATSAIDAIRRSPTTHDIPLASPGPVAPPPAPATASLVPTPAATPAPAEPRRIQPPDPNAPQTAYQASTGRFRHEMELEDALDEAARRVSSGQGGGLANIPLAGIWDGLTFSGTPEEREARSQERMRTRMLTDLLRHPGTFEWLKANPNTVELLLSDPRRWAEMADAAMKAERGAQTTTR